MANEYRDLEREIRKDSHRKNFFKLLEDDINKFINPYRKEFVHAIHALLIN